MRRRYEISRSVCLLLGVLLLGACSTSFHLDRPLTPREGDWLQEGGNATRQRDASGMQTAEQQVRNSSDIAAGVLWEYSMDGPASRAAPLLLDSAVLFPSSTGLVEAVDLRSGEDIGQAPCVWYIEATPAVSGTDLFVATAGVDPLLHCFDLAGRVQRYRTRFPAVHAALCAVDGGVIVAARMGRVARFEARDTAAVWTTELPGVVTAAPAAGDSVVVIAGQDGDLTALSANSGKQLWRLPTGTAFLAGPAIRGDAVAAVNHDGTLVVAGLHDGSLRWKAQLGQRAWLAPAWRGDTLALALSSGDLLLLRASTGAELARFALGELPGAPPLFAGNGLLQLLRDGRLLEIDLADGVVAERYRLPVRSETPVLVTPDGLVMVDEEGEAVCVSW